MDSIENKLLVIGADADGLGDSNSLIQGQVLLGLVIEVKLAIEIKVNAVDHIDR